MAAHGCRCPGVQPLERSWKDRGGQVRGPRSNAQSATRARKRRLTHSESYLVLKCTTVLFVHFLRALVLSCAIPRSYPPPGGGSYGPLHRHVGRHPLSVTHSAWPLCSRGSTCFYWFGAFLLRPSQLALLSPSTDSPTLHGPLRLTDVRRSIPVFPTASILSFPPYLVFRFVLTLFRLRHISSSFLHVQNDAKAIQLVFRYAWTVPWAVVDVSKRRFLAVHSDAQFRKRSVHNWPTRGYPPLGLVSGCLVLRPIPALARIHPHFQSYKVRKFRPETKLAVSNFFPRPRQFSLVQPRRVHCIPRHHSTCNDLVAQNQTPRGRSCRKPPMVTSSTTQHSRRADACTTI